MVFFTDIEPRKRYILLMLAISLICSAGVISYEVYTMNDFALKSRFWILMIFFLETLQIFMMAQYILEFYESKLKLKQWEFEYFRDLEVKKIIHGSNRKDTMRISERNLNINVNNIINLGRYKRGSMMLYLINKMYTESVCPSLKIHISVIM